MLRALHTIEASRSGAVLDLPEQGHANLFRHAARGDVFGVNQRAEALQAQMVEPVVTTGQCSLRCELLAPQVAAHMPADLRLRRPLDSFGDGQPTVADGFIAFLEGERPQSKPVLGIATQVRFSPYSGNIREGYRGRAFSPEASLEQAGTE